MSTDIVIGIDISGKSLDIHILPEDRAQRFANDASGIGELVELAKEMEASLIVMEATGGLESALAAECALSGIPTAVMNPRQIRDFARSLGRLAKTDAIDAEVIARFGSALRPEPRTLSTPRWKFAIFANLEVDHPHPFSLPFVSPLLLV